MPPYNYNVNPAPTSGRGVFGQVPGAVSLPRPAADLRNQVPNLGRLNSTLSGDIMSGLQGQLSPGTVNALQDFDAAWGIGSGMPGSGLAINRLGRNIGRFSEDLKNTAIGQYNQTIPTISRTQTVDPSLQYTIADRNSIFGAAPDPTAAGSHAEQLYNQYLQGLSARSGIRSPGGGTVAPSGDTGFGPGGPPEMVGYGPQGGSGSPSQGFDWQQWASSLPRGSGGPGYSYSGPGLNGLTPEEASLYGDMPFGFQDGPVTDEELAGLG